MAMLRAACHPAPEGLAAAAARAAAAAPAARRALGGWAALFSGAATAPGRRASAGRRAGGPGAVRAAASAAAADAPPAAGAPAGAPRVCVLGGGFGGLYAAVKLEGLLWPAGTKPHVTLVEQADRFTFKPLLYELLTGAAGLGEVAPPYAELLAPYPAVEFVRGRVAEVRPDAPADGGNGSSSGGATNASRSAGGGVVVLESGATLPYDWLVLALGAETSHGGVPGAREHALPFSSYADALVADAALRALAGGAAPPAVAVVGGGYAGVELAAAVAERLGGRGGVTLLAGGPELLPGAPEGQRAAAAEALAARGVEVLAGARVAAVEAPPGGGRLVRYAAAGAPAAEPAALRADLVLWAAGQAPAPAAGAPGRRPALPFPADARGATRTDAALRVDGHARVFALGDVAVAGGAPLPATAQVAFQQADYVAWNLWAALNGKPPLRFAYQHLGDMMSLGSAAGAVALPLRAPAPLAAAAGAPGPLGAALRAAGVRVGGALGPAAGEVTLGGPLAAALRRAAYLYRQPTDAQRLRVAASWAEQAAGGAFDVVARVLAGGRRGGGGGEK
jgi:NADH:ubiquinone reductase (non-electrogenic)